MSKPKVFSEEVDLKSYRINLTLYCMVMPIGTPFLKEKINN